MYGNNIFINYIPNIDILLCICFLFYMSDVLTILLAIFFVRKLTLHCC